MGVICFFGCCCFALRHVMVLYVFGVARIQTFALGMFTEGFLHVVFA